MLYISYNTIFKKEVFPWKSMILIYLIEKLLLKKTDYEIFKNSEKRWLQTQNSVLRQTISPVRVKDVFRYAELLKCMCSVMSDSVTPWTISTRLFCPWNSPGQNTGVGCHFLLQGIFPTQDQTQVSRIAGSRFTL